MAGGNYGSGAAIAFGFGKPVEYIGESVANGTPALHEKGARLTQQGAGTSGLAACHQGSGDQVGEYRFLWEFDETRIKASRMAGQSLFKESFGVSV